MNPMNHSRPGTLGETRQRIHPRTKRGERDPERYFRHPFIRKNALSGMKRYRVLIDACWSTPSEQHSIAVLGVEAATH